MQLGGPDGLWHLLWKYGCLEKFTTMIEALHTGMMANVSVGGEVSESFSITNGVKQGCVLANHALLHFPINNTQRFFPRHGGWHLHTVQIERWPTQCGTLQSDDQDYSDTDEKAAIRRWQCTGCPVCWRDAEHGGCFLRYIKKTKVLYPPYSTIIREVDIMVDGNKLNFVPEFTYITGHEHHSQSREINGEQ